MLSTATGWTWPSWQLTQLVLSAGTWILQVAKRRLRMIGDTCLVFVAVAHHDAVFCLPSDLRCRQCRSILIQHRNYQSSCHTPIVGDWRQSELRSWGEHSQNQMKRQSAKAPFLLLHRPGKLWREPEHDRPARESIWIIPGLLHSICSSQFWDGLQNFPNKFYWYRVQHYDYPKNPRSFNLCTYQTKKKNTKKVHPKDSSKIHPEFLSLASQPTLLIRRFHLSNPRVSRTGGCRFHWFHLSTGWDPQPFGQSSTRPPAKTRKRMHGCEGKYVLDFWCVSDLILNNNKILQVVTETLKKKADLSSLSHMICSPFAKIR